MRGSSNSGRPGTWATRWRRGRRLRDTGETFVPFQAPGTWDVLALDTQRKQARQAAGVRHFGVWLMTATDLGAIGAVEAARGTIVEHGEFVPGEPYLFAQDPHGYTIELWYQLPTPVDPPLESPVSI
jgi:hypothetical protein